MHSLPALFALAAATGCATHAPSTATTPTAPPFQMACREIATPGAEAHPVYCGTSEQVAAVVQRPELLNSGVYCQKLEQIRTGNKARNLRSMEDKPVCMLPEQWNRFNIAGGNVYAHWGYPSARDAAAEYHALTAPSITDAPPFTPPQMPTVAPPNAPTSP